MKNLDRKIKCFEITPKRFLCVGGACPSVFMTEKGTFLMIGKKLDKENIPDEVKRKIGSDEMVIEVPKNLITDLDLIKGG
jgi:hypothetical protein